MNDISDYMGGAHNTLPDIEASTPKTTTTPKPATTTPKPATTSTTTTTITTTTPGTTATTTTATTTQTTTTPITTTTTPRPYKSASVGAIIGYVFLAPLSVLMILLLTTKKIPVPLL